jgi:hypothetical protein
MDPQTWDPRMEIANSNVLPPFRNIRCFSFVKWVYLDIF